MDVVLTGIEPAISEIESFRGALRVAEIRLGGVPRGAVILLCDAGALDRDATGPLNGLAAHGYESVAADLACAGAPGTGAVTDDDLLRDVAALVDGLGERGWAAEQVGLVGYGFGGRVALLAAAEFDLGAAVSIAPAGVMSPLSGALPPLTQIARPVRTPWLGMFGDCDEDTPPPVVRQFGESLDSRSPVHTELVGYPGVTGGFYHDSWESSAHAASFDSWQRTIEWLNLRVAPRLTPLAEAWRARQAATGMGAG